MSEIADVAIVGGGAIGCALAREVAGRGARVVVLERARPGAEASGAAAGLLSPQSDFAEAGPLFELGLESREMYPSWIGAIEEESGSEVGYRRPGVLRCASSGEEVEKLSAYLWQRERGLPLEWWDRAAIAQRLPRPLSPSVEGALFFPEDAVVDSPRLTAALWTAAERRGARFLTGRSATGLWLDGRRCRGVDTESGRIPAGAVVDAAGAWAALEGRIPLAIPIHPVRGQIVELETAVDPLPLVLRSEAVYLVPRREGRLLVGATHELVGFRKEVTAGGVAALLAGAEELVPSLSQARFATAWAGFRPGTPDGLPVLGASEIDGLFFATGHYRSGILLAPITARLLADELSGSASKRDLSAFSVERFRNRFPQRARSSVSAENVFS